jgi:hypothetical protein
MITAIRLFKTDVYNVEITVSSEGEINRQHTIYDKYCFNTAYSLAANLAQAANITMINEVQ